MAFRGLVRARERCVVDGVFHSPGDVFEFRGFLHPGDPYEAVRIIGYDNTHRNGTAVRVPVCQRLALRPEDLHELNRSDP